jgi:multicomponent Na+:H+ antiporter subunit E
MRSFVLFAALFGFYVLLSGQIHSGFLMVVGAIACLVITLIARHMGTVDDEGMPFQYWLSTVAYSPWLIWQVVLANIDVAKRVWAPNMPISPRMIRVEHELKTPYGIATYANSITLTPGTVTVRIEDDFFEVHALTEGAAKDLFGGEMHRRVLEVEAAGLEESA